MGKLESTESSIQRGLMLVIAIGLLLWGGIAEWTSDQVGTSVGNAALIRVGIVMLACWIAYPMLRRPVAWLPPGAAAIGVILIGAVAFRPKLLVILVPLFGVLLAFAAIARFFRRGS